MLPPLPAVTHELRTPLHGILALVQLLEGTALDADQSAHVAAIGEAAHGLLGVVEDGLALGRLDAGRLPIRPAPCDPHAVAEEVARTLGALAGARGLALAVVRAGGDAAPPATLVTDAARVRQILVNLVGNAVKVTARGGVTVHVARTADGGAAWTVRDTGPGMTDAVRARLFAAWERPADTDVEGAGLGLALARALAQALGGTLGVETAPGAGSAFTLALPAAPPASGAQPSGA